ncbi:FAD-binding oxidoreductase [Rhizobium sp. MHM7A]|uniref:NAD(P)/FAD-dependent oxidoreductase n=1 Tax=Rhizobium sp. MHM7A TaxID=2583233 RepID=UPI001106461A|nr:FAD-binding oxidoreductase [Rhizobium sp. MHM7A]TLX08600.1 FAD-dependent oxidoreductase [Rhizobium sp. MHM7A]
MRYTLRPPVLARGADRSFWLQDAGAAPVTTPLAGDQAADVAIVGGGYTGLWTALRLKEQDPGLKIVLLEADCCGAGASGRNGGQVHSWFAEIDLLAGVVGETEALSLCRATADAIDELEALQASGAIGMDLRLDGWLWTASARAQEGAWRQALDMAEAHGEARFTPLDAGEIARRTGSSASYMGIAEMRAGTVQPGKLAAGLRRLALARHVIIHEKTPVTAIEPGAIATLHTPQGPLRAGRVVLAANAWLASIPELLRYIYVVESQIVATERVPDLLQRLGWTGGESICDAQAHVLYYQRTPEGRVIFGRGSGKIAYGDRIGPSFNRGTEKGADNRRELDRVYPELRTVKIEHDWSGPIDCTADHLPIFGHLTGQPNIFFGIGFNGTGIAQTPVAGRILASLVLGRDDQWSRSGLVGLGKRKKLPPEPIRYLGARLLRKAIRLRNDAEIENRQVNPLVRYISELKPGR